MFKIYLAILIGLFSFNSMGEVLLPVGNQMLKLPFDKTYTLKNTCPGKQNFKCYEVKKKKDFISLMITDLTQNKHFSGELMSVCKSDIKKTKKDLSYCIQNNSAIFIKNKRLITVNIKSKKLKLETFLAEVE